MEQNQHNEAFQYTYSAKEQEELQKIRSKYVAKEENKMDQLRRLDASVSSKATVKALIMGVIGALIMGGGMSLTMTEIGTMFGLGENTMLIGIVIGIAGMILAGFAYPVYMRTLKKEREKIASEIIRLADELIKQ